jgi:Ni/Fe-hydrogenase subunit HybB-like protein
VSFADWNGTSVLLEVALCMMAYTLVLLVEISPALLERWSAEGRGARADLARAWLPRIERALPFVIAVGLVLPTMHQSSLGSLLLVARTKVHPLWHTGLLPLLFLLTAFAMGYAIIFFEAIFSAHAFGRPLETRLFARLGAFVAGVIALFLAVRFGGLAAAGRLGLTVGSGGYSFFFWAETLLLAAAAFLFLQQGVKASAAAQLQAALLALAGGTLYRIDAFLTAYRPGQGWVYFPSYFEILITLGIVATETVAYVWLVRRFPILAGVTETRAAPVPAALGQGAAS